MELDGSSAVDRLVKRAIRALSLLSQELGVAVAPGLDKAIFERLELIQVSTDKVLMVLTIKSGFVRTIYVDLPGEVRADVLTSVTQVLNELRTGISSMTTASAANRYAKSRTNRPSRLHHGR